MAIVPFSCYTAFVAFCNIQWSQSAEVDLSILLWAGIRVVSQRGSWEETKYYVDSCTYFLEEIPSGGLLGQPIGVGVDFVGDTATGCWIPEVILFQSNIYYLAPKCVFTKSIFVTLNGRSHYSWSNFAFLSIIFFLTNFRKALGTACPLRGEGKKTQLTHHPSLLLLRSLLTAFDQLMLSAFLHPDLFSYLQFGTPKHPMCSREEHPLKGKRTKAGTEGLGARAMFQSYMKSQPNSTVPFLQVHGFHCSCHPLAGSPCQKVWSCAPQPPHPPAPLARLL